jgi:hypothetical protein
MKDQYVGDVNDYMKYALLRALAGVHPGALQVCWMRTARDGRTDGARIGYLDDHEGLGMIDPPVFQALRQIARDGRRTVRAVETAAILPGARFHTRMLRDDRAARRAYFRAVWDALGSDDLVFFDPDNGLEVRSVRDGQPRCSKYLFWQELGEGLGEDRSVCVYQHFPRVRREAFVTRLLTELRERFPRHRSFAVSSTWVVYLVCGRPSNARRLRRAAVGLVDRSQSRLMLAG